MAASGRMTRRGFLKALGAGAAATAAPRWLGAAAAAGDTGRRPDIVIMMADDMGFSDIGCYGGEIRTPNLDGLAAGGLRFTQFYNTARCCPTRASLLTGLYPHQAGVGHMTGDYGLDGYRGDLNRQCVTIAEVLRPAGYGTYMSGKWHVTRHTGPDGPKDNWPCQRGFDRYYGTLVGAGSFWRPSALTEDNTQVKEYPEGFYYTDAISDHAAQFIREHHKARPDAPLLLYVAYTSPHWPLHAPRGDVERYLGKYSAGWDALRAARHRRQIDMGLVKGDWAITPRDAQATAWDDVPEDRKENMDLRMAVYAAQIDRMDQGIGRIVRALKDTGRLEDTLLMFLADNGGCAEGGPWGFENKKGGQIGEDSSFASYGLSWANASNTPFRLYKHWVHEGGIASPLVVHWPARVKARGELRHQPGHLIDLMATCVDVSGAAYPKEFAGQAVTPMEGRSLVPAFQGGPIEREVIYWEHEGNRAIRRGRWKLVSRHGRPWELFDMEADRTELNDLSARQPQLVAELTALWDAWAKRSHVAPWGSWSQGGKGGQDVGAKATEFDLKNGDDLPRERCPRIAGRGFAVTATLRDAADGVIVAQGGSSLGWALYVGGGRLAMATRHDGALAAVTAPDKLPAGEVEVGGRLGKDGRIALTVAGKEVATGKAPGPISAMPQDGLQVGRDEQGAVGEYDPTNPFGGRILKVRVSLDK